MLACVAAQRGGGRCHQQRPLATLLHRRQQHLRQAEQAEGGHAPAHLELLQRGAGQAAVADLRAQVEHRHRDRADVGLDVGDELLDAAFFHRVEHEAAGRAALGPDLGHQPVQPGLVAAACEAGVVPLAGKALGHVAPDAGTGAEDQADRLVHGLVLFLDGPAGNGRRRRPPTHGGHRMIAATSGSGRQPGGGRSILAGPRMATTKAQGAGPPFRLKVPCDQRHRAQGRSDPVRAVPRRRTRRPAARPC